MALSPDTTTQPESLVEDERPDVGLLLLLDVARGHGLEP
jgi:hypothetical protein